MQRLTTASPRTRIPPRRTERRDPWWSGPLVVVAVLGPFILYATWAAFQNANYYVAPYLSPFYSPCLSVNCAHITLPLVGAWWVFSPAILVLGAPLSLRATCYYYRKAYYRSFFGLPPACSVPDVFKRYSGETKFPFILQNLHRYFLILATFVLAFLWWDVFLATQFPTANGTTFGVGLGTLVLLANTLALSLYTFSCHSYRYLLGGRLDVISTTTVQRALWRATNWLNPRHALLAWLSLFSVVIADVYIRLLAMGVFRDIRFI